MRREVSGSVLRFLALLLLLAVLVALTGSAWLLAAALLLLLLPPASLGLNVCLRHRLRAELSVPTTAAKTAALRCTLRVQNDALLPVGRYFCTVEVCNDLTGEREELQLSGGVGAKRSACHSFLLQSSHCGRLYIRVRTATMFDCLGLLPLHVDLHASARSTVLPELFPVETVLTAHPASAEDGTADRRGEDRSEVFQLRAYQPGDDIRQIHWKLSAKLDTLLLREGSQPESRSLLLFWDKREQGTPEQMDALAEVVASVSSALAESGTPFTLSWTERDELQMQDIAEEDSLLQAIPALVKNTGTADCRLPDFAGFGRILYFGIQPEASLPEVERIHWMLCTRTALPQATVFGTQDYQDVLQRLEV